MVNVFRLKDIVLELDPIIRSVWPNKTTWRDIKAAALMVNDFIQLLRGGQSVGKNYTGIIITSLCCILTCERGLG